MKRVLISVLATIFFAVSAVPVSHSQEPYQFFQLTRNPVDWDAGAPKINDNGWVTWGQMYWGANPYQDDFIHLYDGMESGSIAACDFFDETHEALDINNVGHVVWEAASEEGQGNQQIFLYDGENVVQISDDSHGASGNYSPRINDHGEVVWSGQGIWFYDGVDATRISDSGAGPEINNLGQVAWSYYDGSVSDVYFYDGTAVIQLTENGDASMLSPLSDGGYLAWAGRVDGVDREVFLYDGNDVTQLTDNDIEDVGPHTNAGGQVVWHSQASMLDFDCDHWEIFLYDGHTTTQLTNDDLCNFDPKINDNGRIAWSARPDLDTGLQYFLTEIYVHDGSGIAQVTNDVRQDIDVQINGDGFLVWESAWYDFNAELGIRDIFLGVPCSAEADYDGDGYMSITCGGNDCNDQNPLVNPGATEIPGNGIDDDCDVSSPTWGTPASVVPSGNKEPSDFTNLVLSLSIPMGGVLLLRILRRKR